MQRRVFPIIVVEGAQEEDGLVVPLRGKNVNYLTILDLCDGVRSICILCTAWNWGVAVGGCGCISVLSQNQPCEIVMNQRRVAILRICGYGRRRGAMSTVVFRITTQRTTHDIVSFFLLTSSWNLHHNVSKRSRIFTGFFFRNLHYTVRLLQHFKAYWAMSDSFPTKCLVFHKFIQFSFRNIQVFRDKKRARNILAVSALLCNCW